MEAAKQHIRKRVSDGAGPEDVVFPAYAHCKADENATVTDAGRRSSALMRHVFVVTDDKKFTDHSLRHGLLNKLRDAGASEAVRDPCAGHPSKSIGDRVDHSREARERELRGWIEKAQS